VVKAVAWEGARCARHARGNGMRSGACAAGKKCKECVGGCNVWGGGVVKVGKCVCMYGVWGKCG